MNKLIALDPGHGAKTAGKRTPKFPNGEFMHEWEFNNAVVQIMTLILAQNDFDVLNVAPNDTDVSLTARINAANNTTPNKFNRAADLYLSIHANAHGDGVNFNDANGIETFVYANAAPNCQAIQWAQVFQTELIAATNATNRGVKRGDLYVLNATKMTAILVECGFMTNQREAELLISNDYRLKCANALVKAICKIFNVTQTTANGTTNGTTATSNGATTNNVGANIVRPYTPTTETPILSKPTATVAQMQQWATTKGAKPFFVALAPIFYTIATKENVNPVLAFCQSAKETAYGKFGGVLNETYCNPCGMKNPQGGGDYDPNAHKRFKTWEQGISAQVDHLALYAGANFYPRTLTDDPRHFAYLLCTAKTAEQLGGKWAPSTTYGEEIVKMMNEVENTKTATITPPPTPTAPSAWAAEAWQWAISNKITDGTNPQATATREQVVQLLYNASKIK